MSIDGISGRNHLYDRSFADAELALADGATSRQWPSMDEDSTSALLLEGDIGAQVAALAIRSAQEQRKANRDIQVAEEAALERAEAQQVEAMHRKADDIRMEGIAEGLFGMGNGALTMCGGFEESDSEKQIYRGRAMMSEAGGKMAGGLFRGNQADDEANATTHEHEAGHHKRNLDAARDAIREGQDLLERALDFYKQSQQSANDAVNTSVRRT